MSLHVDRQDAVAHIVAEHAATAAVFRELEIDFCCRGEATLAQACRARRLDPDEVLARLERAITAAAPERPDARRGSRSSVIAHIVEQHHAYERRALPYIVSLLPKIAGRYGKRDAQLDALCDVGQDLAEALEVYMEEEERKLLPALADGGCEVVRGELSRHDRELRVLLSQVRSLASGFVAPDWGDQSYRALMEELEALEEDVTDRLHVERHVLVPHATR